MNNACPAPPRREEASEHPAPAVLLVDDSPHFLRDATAFLRALGVTVVGSFEDAIMALAQVRALAPDVALVDLRMRGLPGLEAIPRLREMMPDLGIVAMSLTPGYRRAAMAAGADEFVDKAAFDTELLPAIHRAADAAARRHQNLPPTPGRAEAIPC